MVCLVSKLILLQKNILYDGILLGLKQIFSSTICVRRIYHMRSSYIRLIFNPLTLSGFFYLKSLDRSISSRGTYYMMAYYLD